MLSVTHNVIFQSLETSNKNATSIKTGLNRRKQKNVHEKKEKMRNTCGLMPVLRFTGGVIDDRYHPTKLVSFLSKEPQPTC